MTQGARKQTTAVSIMSSASVTFDEDLSDSSDHELETDSDASLETDTDLEELYASFDFEDDASQASCTQTLVESAENIRGTTETLLYPGAQLSPIQSRLLVFQYAIRHSLTTKAFTELLQLLSVHVPRGAAIPKSVHRLKNYFVESFPEAKANRHFYCSCCQRPIPSTGAPSCSGNGCSGGRPVVFITIPLGPQIKRMMEGV